MPTVRPSRSSFPRGQGLGGVLPGAKVTEEISATPGVPVGQTVVSPPAHTAFTTPLELVHFIATLRSLSGGKPIGFKLCIGARTEFLSICKAMLQTGSPRTSSSSTAPRAGPEPPRRSSRIESACR